jgi:hypothetical protein
VRILGGAMKFFAAASAALALTAASPSQSQAATGTVRLHVVKGGVVLGGTNGDGFLYFGHRRYHLTVTGSSIGTVGVATLDLVGTVSNLRLEPRRHDDRDAVAIRSATIQRRPRIVRGGAVDLQVPSLLMVSF